MLRLRSLSPWLFCLLLLIPVPPIYRYFFPVATRDGADHVALLADTQNSCIENQRQVVATLARHQDETLILAGDVVNACLCTAGNGVCIARLWDEQLALLNGLPTMRGYAPGNHDHCHGDMSIDEWTAHAGATYSQLDTDHACFFLVDDNQRQDAAQAAWLKSAIALCNRPWRILVKHLPMPHGAYDWPEIEAGSAYDDAEVDVVVAGHQHAFAVSEDARGRLNITLPAAGCFLNWMCKPYPIQAPKTITPFIVPAYGFGELQITADALNWSIYRYDDLLLLSGQLRRQS